ncbi:hypothetical protein B5C34_01085 [Pacificimonas flava]|uniref:HTH marR-type domain-containing protein n=2 Tax=Pacificimonas TaxID=1960290 RepID=A0A219B1G8_9SPHN|nr:MULTISPECIES: helix-turn-helix domain-containing protein [Pacificimonas]MBZ6378191.1 MarR family transcriptional regulator [Pacificimonas aurantium]OWV32181.1 hypothetical protein B5C34_01085 [Pacificimonas flava]
MSASSFKLGTMLRHLIDLLDGDLEAIYARVAPGYRPRYTPVVRALLKHQPCTIGAVAADAGITHSAASQTVAKMLKEGLVTSTPGDDGRERLISLSSRTEAALPALEEIWAATTAATAALDAELATPLIGAVEEAIRALDAKSFEKRISSAAPFRSSDNRTAATPEAAAQS